MYMHFMTYLKKNICKLRYRKQGFSTFDIGNADRFGCWMTKNKLIKYSQDGYYAKYSTGILYTYAEY